MKVEGGKQSSSLKGRLIGPTVAGIAELLVFHPVDTVAKRLMSHEGSIAKSSDRLGTLNKVIFRKHADAGFFAKWGSLFPGLGFGAAYKITQRVYKFGGQPFVVDLLDHRCRSAFDVFGSYSSVVLKATAGSMIGVGEIVLLPLDVLKIKAQTNPGSLKGRGIVTILQEEGIATLYRGAGWTAARNAPGSFSLFGAAALAKKMMGVREGQKVTFFQDFVASIVGSVASITVAAPFDVVKTRIQLRDFSDPRSGARIVSDLVRNEGFGAFFKGLVPKVVVVGPKLIFSFTIAQQMIQLLS
eukprot:EG_transcript_10283